MKYPSRFSKHITHPAKHPLQTVFCATGDRLVPQRSKPSVDLGAYALPVVLAVSTSYSEAICHGAVGTCTGKLSVEA